MLLKQGVDQMMNVVAIQLVENNYNDLCLKLYVLIINFANNHSNYIPLYHVILLSYSYIFSYASFI
jgi:hypothetical protein